MTEYTTIRVRVSRATSLKLAAAARHHGCSSSQLLRLMLSKVLHDEPPVASTVKPASAEKIQLNVQLTQDEHSALCAAAASEGLRRTEWVVKLIRATLTRKPQFNRAELDALMESNRQIAAIGRNLNQIARNINMDPNASRSVTVERIRELLAEIDEHQVEVRMLTDASLNRWSTSS